MTVALDHQLELAPPPWGTSIEMLMFEHDPYFFLLLLFIFFPNFFFFIFVFSFYIFFQASFL